MLIKARPDWNEYFIGIAEAVSKRSTCPRAHVGAVIVDERNRIIGTGYNGSPPNQDHCSDVTCDLQVDIDGKYHCQRTIHAEVNAAIHSYGDLEGAVVYIYKYNSPASIGSQSCHECKKVLMSAGIRAIYSVDNEGTSHLDILPEW